MAAQDLTRPDGTVALDALLDALQLTETDLALALGVPRASPDTPSQRELQDLVEILATVSSWAGSLPQAFAWFSTQTLPSFGGKTAADLVREGRAEAVKSYAARMALGGYA
ncbi:hypothetical protein NHG85_10270 [Limimaricola sp. ASW11-118]|uniref:Antitoxin Xre/MbcA/ParS-like toxin-binding domain-containing protein n=1 Tax=Limimaricola litoreus TaxID=2955316 RepID=A0A9X2FP85_9RHOB|nr:hypothetical protein [Limimaricola litoreus]MCP1168904.1 hypothetical protein [Limimaricola litoreus]